MCAGVSKSGSPAPKLTTSIPSALSFAALADTASVGDGSTTDNLRASFTVSTPCLRFSVSAAATPGGTRPETSPPINATSFTSEEDT